MTAADADPPTDLSVDDLATEAGVTVRTVRFYQSEGLLPAPERRGRAARYGAAHLDRLRLITSLQERGLRLSAIADLLRAADDASAADWLGLGESLSRPWTDDTPVLLNEAELHAKLDGLPEPDANRRQLVRAGLVERRADTTPVVYLVPSPGLLDVGLHWARLGLDPGTGIRLQERLRARLREAADELVAGLTEDISLERLAGAGPGGLAELLDQVRPLTRRTVDLLFAHEMERAQREVLDASTAEPANTPPPPPSHHTDQKGTTR